MIPRAPLFLGLAGLLPFLWGALTLFSSDIAIWTTQNIGARFGGPFVMLNYGTIILAFMSGVLWGFSTRGDKTLNYVLSVLPALWVFFMVGAGATSSAIYLITGFLGLLSLDWHFAQQALTPQWWMRLRIFLTVVVIACLSLLVI
ncbi:MAG: DUF3429 domain-containing protein [Silicimonas sp.]|nr:DUF3429 domain-containing protein [Silicimonas sp.]